MMVRSLYILCVLTFILAFPVHAQKDYDLRKPLIIDVNAIRFQLSTQMGDGGMAIQPSWNLTKYKQESETFFYPQDRFYSNMLFHLFNVACLDDNGFIGIDGQRHERVWERWGSTTEYSWERRRYRPPHIIVDGKQLDPPYLWEVDPDAPADYVGTFEDIFRGNRETGYGGFRSKVNLYAFSNPNHDNYIIWEETRYFTGETLLPRESDEGVVRPEDYLPNQTVRLWWAMTFGFGPTKGGEREMWGFYPYEGEDDLDNWFRRPSQLVTGASRNELVVAYATDWFTTQARPYEIKDDAGNTLRVSVDDTGDPNRVNGRLTSTQVPGFAILYADKSTQEHVDDPNQPVAAPHANIVEHFFGQRFNFAMRDHYAGLNNPWPGPPSKAEKGTMRILTVGPYEMTLERDAQGNPVRIDSFKVVYVIAVGDVGYEMADSLGKAWFRGEISDAEKNAFIEMGKDSLFQAVDRAYWAWKNHLKVPSPPPPPDIEVTSGPDYNTVSWSYPEDRYFLDPDTGQDDFYAWRVYRKTGGYWVNDPRDAYAGYQWELVYETTNRNETTYIDRDVERGVSYYYAVTAVDNGSQNTFGLFPGQRLESSRFANRTQLPAIPFKPGLDTSEKVRVVPNPVTRAAGALAFPGEPDKILFVNLPFEATLSIYTETGELVKRIKHYGSADESWNQRTDDNQYVASGIYILAVHNVKDSEGRPLPDQFVKFVIIR